MNAVPRPSRAAACALLLTLLACSNGNRPVAVQPIVPPLVITAVQPPSGASGVGLRSVISVAFIEELDAMSDADFEVSDGLGPLLGVRSFDTDLLRWTWTPVSELPRGATLQVALGTGLRGRSGTALAVPYTWSFTVSDGVMGAVDALGPTAASVPLFTAVARNGQAAIASGDKVWDWNGAFFIGGSVTTAFGAITGLTSDSVGQLAALCARQGPAGFELSVGRRPVQGTWQFEGLDSRSGLVLGLSRLQTNLRGDLLVYWYGTGQATSADAAWLSPTQVPAWSSRPLPVVPTYTLRGTAVDGFGAPWYLHAAPQSNSLMIHRQSSATAATTETLPLPADWRLGVDGAGTGHVLVQTNTATANVLSLVRSVRGAAFGPALTVASADSLQLVDLAVADCGETVVLYRQGNTLFGRRIDAIGNMGAPHQLHFDAAVIAMAPRGETWLVGWYATPGYVELDALRWRPGLEPDAGVGLVAGPLSDVRGPVSAAVDDSGRVVVAWVQGQNSQNLEVRAARFQ